MGEKGVVRDLDNRVRGAVRHFWLTRKEQARASGRRTERRPYGGRAAATGGRQLDGFIHLVRDVLVESELPHQSIHIRKREVILPGWFRPVKQWDLIALVDDTLLAVIEFKSQVGSFGNNFNNRAEEAIGSAIDLITAYREGAFRGSARPWVGYFMLLEDAPRSRIPVSVSEPHFPVFPEFQGASYIDRYRILCEKLIRERLYDAACLILSSEAGGLRGDYTEPSPELSFRTFATSLTAHALAFARLRKG